MKTYYSSVHSTFFYTTTLNIIIFTSHIYFSVDNNNFATIFITTALLFTIFFLTVTRFLQIESFELFLFHQSFHSYKCHFNHHPTTFIGKGPVTTQTSQSLTRQSLTLHMTASKEEEEKKAQEGSPSMIMEKRTPLSFSFCGYSLWLQMEEVDMDVTKALQHAVDFHGLHPIPEPHVTLIYGMTHLSKEEVLHIFQNEFKSFISTWSQNSDQSKIQAVGLLADKTFDGVNGENMDIAWSELTFATSDYHEKMLENVYSIFQLPRSSNQRWKPHLSLAYDNPLEDTPVTIARTLELVNSYPTLLTVPQRKIQGISLWDTNGTLDEWKCLDRILL